MFEVASQPVTNPAPPPEPAPPTASVPPPSPEIDNPVDAALKKLDNGQVAFNTPEHMRVGRSQTVQAVLSETLASAALMSQVTAPGAKEVAPLKVAQLMRATLSGGAFDIAQANSQQQLTSRDDVTTWTWTVTPKFSGKQVLALSFDAVLAVGGDNEPRTLRTFTHDIDVEIAWPETAGEWFTWFKNLFDNASWLWASILVPVAGWLGHHFFRRRKRREKAARLRMAARRPPAR